MKAVLISIQPKWCELIASGKKTIEVRKTRPKIETPFKCYIYCTKNGEILIERKDLKDRRWPGIIYERVKGKVIGEFVCDRIGDIPCYVEGGKYDEYLVENKFLQDCCLSYNEIFEYLGGNDGYGWHISKLKIYYKPKELGEFRKEGFMTEEQWLYALYPNTHCHYAAWAKRFEITRPPQSWCYVEELQ